MVMQTGVSIYKEAFIFFFKYIYHPSQRIQLHCFLFSNHSTEYNPFFFILFDFFFPLTVDVVKSLEQKKYPSIPPPLVSFVKSSLNSLIDHPMNVSSTLDYKE